MKHNLSPANFYSGQPNYHHLFQQTVKGIILQEEEISSITNNYGWGMAYININKKALQNYRFEIKDAVMRMKNGIWLNIPGNAALVNESFNKFSKQVEDDNISLPVWLGIKNFEPHQTQIRHSENDKEIRPFIAKEEKIEDDNELYNDEYIQLKLLDPRIFFGNPSFQENYEFLKIGEISLAEDNDNLVFNESYIPPLLKIGASSNFTEDIDAFVTYINNKVKIAQNEIMKLNLNIKPDMSQILTCSRLNAMAGSLLVLKQMKKIKETHPLQVYYELLRLCGNLSIISPQTQISTAPKYDHEDLQQSFNDLYTLIKNMTQGIAKVDFINIDFKQVGSNKLICDVKEEWLKQVDKIFLSVEVNSHQDEDIILNKNKTKIVPLSEIKNIQIDKLSGLSCKRISKIPIDLDCNDDNKRFYQFDLLEKQDHDWWGMLRKEPLAVFIIGAKLPKLRLHVSTEYKVKINE